MTDDPPPLLASLLACEIPPLDSTEREDDPIVHAKLSADWSDCAWYVTEFDGDDLCFGLRADQDASFVYFSLAELQALRGPDGLVVEQDMAFIRQPLSIIHDNVTGLGSTLRRALELE